LQEVRRAAREKRLEMIRAGTAKSAKTAEVKASGKAFYKQMIADSDYQGEDYEVFAKWLSQGHGEEKDTK
jgi:large subunit ribosomal protein L4e